MQQDKIVLCETCATLNLQRSDFERPPFEPEGRYRSVVLTDTLDNLLSRHLYCPLCRLFLHTLQKNEQENASFPTQTHLSTRWEVQWMQSSQEYDPFGTSEDMYGSALFPKLDTAESHNNYSVQLVDDCDSTAFLRGRVPANTVNLLMVQGWLDSCHREHGPNCTPVALEMPPHPRTVQDPFIVIDVQQQCLVELPIDEEYVALSYVWGPSNWPRTLESNFNDFKMPGAFVKHPLPRTIADTVDLVKALGKKYLWVDTLCIIQDHAMKQQLINNMDTVYGHAHLTVIAASGNHADAGLSGWSDKAERTNAVVTEFIKPGLRLGVLPFFDFEIMLSAHAQRAWTFQEGLLSSRCLVFLNGLAYFCCRSAVWREDIYAELGNLVRPFEGANTLGRTLSPFPLRQYQLQVTAYTYRKLTFASDALNAFAGAHKALARAMDNTRFWYGMPSSVFDWALMWSGASGERLTRRQGFPSWTWAGWEGYITLALDHYSEFDHEWLLYWTWIDWYIADEKGNSTLLWNPQRDGTKKTELMIRRREDGRAVLAGPSCDDDDDGNGKNGNDNNDDNDDEDAADDQASTSKSSEDDDTMELQPCPQYGWPVEDNPYGRLSQPHCSPPFPVKTSTPNSRSVPLKPGTLSFTTVVAKYNLHSLSTGPILNNMNRSQTQRSDCFLLTDSEGRTCGVIWDQKMLAVDSSQLPIEVETIILSYAAPGTKGPFLLLDLSLPSVYKASTASGHETKTQRVLGEIHSWDMLNVMLVVPTTSPHQDSYPTYESRGIGLLHKNALEHAIAPGAHWKEVCLY